MFILHVKGIGDQSGVTAIYGFDGVAAAAFCGAHLASNFIDTDDRRIEVTR